MFVKDNPQTENQTAEIIKIAAQHIFLLIVTVLVVALIQTETFWETTNYKQTICFYSIHLLIVLTVPWFTLGEHVSSIVRQCFIVAIA